MNPERPFSDDSEFALRALGGDTEAFGTLVAKYQGPIHRYALHFFRNPTRAEDVAQDTFLRAYRFLHTYDPARKFSTWLYAIARNQCIDRQREDARRSQVDVDSVSPGYLAAAPSESPHQLLEDRENRERLLGAIGALPEKYRAPVLLCYVEGLGYQEISEILGISLNNTKIRIHRAKKMILRTLGDGDGEP